LYLILSRDRGNHLENYLFYHHLKRVTALQPAIRFQPDVLVGNLVQGNSHKYSPKDHQFI